MAGRALPVLSALGVSRGPEAGGSPPKHRQRVNDEEEFKDEGIDPSQWGLARFSKKQVNNSVSEAVDRLEGKLEKKFDRRFEVLAEVTDDIETGEGEQRQCSVEVQLGSESHRRHGEFEQAAPAFKFGYLFPPAITKQ